MHRVQPLRHGGCSLGCVGLQRGEEEARAHRLLSSEVYSSSFMRGASAATDGKEQLMYLSKG